MSATPARPNPDLRQAIELDPNWPNVREWLAFTLAAQGQVH